MQSPVLLQLLLLALMGTVSAQFGGFFDQMFGGGGGGGGGQQQRQEQNVPSDSAWYRSNVDAAVCSNYLCPDTLGAFSRLIYVSRWPLRASISASHIPCILMRTCVVFEGIFL